MTEIKEEDKYCKGSLSDPDGLELFKKGNLKDGKPYTNEDGSRIPDRFPKKVIVTKALSQAGKDYYTVYAEIGCLWTPKTPNPKTIVSGTIHIDGEDKTLNVYDNESYYGLEIREKDDVAPF
tara:strand:- start:172 stop:537 length:366 start_codon:yes stop_codon:yes gene_type:complete